MSEQGNGSVALSSAQTAAATAPATTTTKKARGTTTDNPVIVAAAKIDRILKGLATDGQRQRVLDLVTAKDV